MLNILQDRLQLHVNRELPDVQAWFIKGTVTTDQIANICWSIEKAREFQKNICFIDCAKGFGCVDQNNLWRILKEVRISGHLTCILRNLYGDQEAIVRTRHEAVDCFKLESGLHQGCILSSCSFNIYTEDITWNFGLDESQAGIKIAGGNISNLRYADDITIMAESKKKLKSLLMWVKEESENAGLQLHIQNMKIIAPSSHYFMANRWWKSGNSDRFYFLELQNHCGWWLQPQI